MKFRAAWVVQAPVGFLVMPARWTRRRVEFDEEQHVVAAQHDGVDGEEVARDDPGSLGTQERRPRLRCSAGCGIDPRCLEDRPDRRRRDGDAEAGEFAVDAAVAPGRVLPSETDDRPTDLERGRMAGRAGAGRSSGWRRVVDANARIVSGLTSKIGQRSRPSARASAVRTARSSGSKRGRAIWRCSTAS